jgi:AraC-like DNA-binding protein
VIRSIWQIDDPAPGKNETIIPKGVVEIIFDLSESVPVRSGINNKEYQLAKCFINGFNTRPVQLQFPEKHFFFGVQFHPAAIKHLLGVPASEFTNLPVDLALLDTSFHSLWEPLAEATTFPERVAVITGWIEHRIIEAHPQELLLNSFLENTNMHTFTINELAKTVCYSPRHLSRKIYEHTGMNTEQFLLYKKYLQAVHMTHHTDLALTAIAYHCNFSDQSHFIRSFKSFALITPKEYRQNKSYVPGHMLKHVR